PPELASFWISGIDDVWAAGPSGIGHFQNGSWSAPPPVQLYGTGIWGVSDSNLWAVGCMGGSCSATPGGPAPPAGAIMHFDGSSAMWMMEAVPMSSPALGIWGSGPADVYVTAPEGLFHFDGNSWTRGAQAGGLAAPTGPIWGSSASDVWVAADGEVLHFDGAKWVVIFTLASPDLVRAIWGTGPNDVWLAGNGQVAHWDGSAIATTALTGYDLHAIWGSAPDDLFVGGIGGALLHFDGTDWLPVRLPMMGDVLALAGATAAGVWVGGAFGG